MRAFVDYARWMREFEQRARQRNDAPRLRLVRIHRDGWWQLQRDPEQALTLYQEGIALARQLHEPHWELICAYWCCEAYLYYLGEVDQAESWAVRNFVKVHQQPYEDSPVIGRIYLCLIDVLYMRDSEGNVERLGQMLDYLEQQVPLEYETYTRVVRHRASLYYTQDDWEAADRYGKQALGLVQGTTAFSLSNAYSFLASVAYHRQQPQEVLEYAVETEREAVRARLPKAEGAACIAQAYGLIQLGQVEEARQKYAHGMELSADSTTPHGQVWYHFACGYLEQTEGPEAALQLRGQQLAALVVRALPAHEADCRLARLRLLGKMERQAEFEQELDALRQALAKLKSPITQLRALQRIEVGDYSQ